MLTASQKHLAIVAAITVLSLASLGAVSFNQYLRTQVIQPAPLLGDIDLDGDVDSDDLDGFVLGLTDPAAYEAQYGVSPVMHGNLNQDGYLDINDVEPFVGLVGG